MSWKATVPVAASIACTVAPPIGVTWSAWYTLPEIFGDSRFVSMCTTAGPEASNPRMKFPTLLVTKTDGMDVPPSREWLPSGLTWSS